MIDQIVIGGGISGLLTAFYLQKAGKEVCLLERGMVGRESSWAGGGIISPLYPWRYAPAVTQLVKWSQIEFPNIVESLTKNTEVDAELVTSGMLVLGEPDQQNALTWAQQSHTNVNLIGGDEVIQLEPTLGTTPQSALWLPDIAQVRNPRLVKALREFLLKHSVLIQENTEVTEIIIEDNRVMGVITDQTTFKTKQVAIACGAWSSKLWPKFGPELDVKPIRGQMILFKTRPNFVKRIVLADEHYVIPRQDGRVLIGSTIEDVGFDKTTTKKARDTLENFAYTLIPALQDFPIEHHWAGLRPGTPDNIPKIRQHPQIEGLFINAGHFRNGVVTAPSSAQLLANLMLNQDPILDPAAYC